MPRILLTGATGFVGAHLARGLSEAGHIIGAVLRASSDGSSLEGNVHRLLHDGSTETLYRLVHDFKPDVVVHAATHFISVHRPDDILPMIEGNVLFGAQLLDAMSRNGVRRLVNFGTSWQHFDGDRYNATNFYAATKQAFEDLAAYYVEADRFTMLTLMLSDTYGPNDKRSKLIALLNRINQTGERMAMSPGAQKLNFLHVDDVIEGVKTALERVNAMPDAAAESYALRGSETMSLREFVSVFEKASGRAIAIDWGARPYRPREVMEPWLGPLLPGWSPKVHLQKGLEAILR